LAQTGTDWQSNIRATIKVQMNVLMYLDNLYINLREVLPPYYSMPINQVNDLELSPHCISTVLGRLQTDNIQNIVAIRNDYINMITSYQANYCQNETMAKDLIYREIV
jgi:hypothetical protein